MSNKNPRRVVSTNTLGSKTEVKYSDGSTKTYHHTSSKSSSTSSSSSSKSSSTSSSKSSSSYSNNYHGYSGGYSYSYSNNKPALAFKAFDIEFWGTPKTKLDDIIFQEGDLIINCTGTKWTPKTPPKPKIFAKESPDWLNLPEVLVSPVKEHNNGELAQQLLLDWPDMKPPPEAADLEFWGEILDQARANGIKRIIACCMAGQGRTGTALSSLLLASGAVDEPDLAIDYIRENYNSKAVETKGQEEYIFSLIYEEADLPPTPTSTSKKL